MQIAPNLQLCLSLAEEFSKSRNQDKNVVSLFCQIILANEKYSAILRELGFGPEKLAAVISDGISNAFPELLVGEKAAKELEDILNTANAVAEDFELEFVDCEHVMFGIMQESSTILAWMSFSEFPKKEFSEKVELLLDYDDPEEEADEDEANHQIPPNMQRFLTNISSEIILQGAQIFGREKEISSVGDILVRRKKNNVLLVGENGVGRKSICRGLAEKITMGKVSEFLAGRIVYQLDVTKLVSGSGMVGALESRMSNLLTEMESEEDTILIVPNIADTVGAGNKEGAMDVANLLKAFLISEKVPVVAICTQSEYKKNIEKDNSLVNLFEVQKVEEPPKEETRKMLVNSLERIQAFHCVNIELSAIDEIINLCERFLPYRKFPEKAFDVLDSILAANKNIHYTHPKEISAIEDKIVKKLRPNLEKGSREYKQVEKLSDQYAKRLEKWAANISKKPPIVSAKSAISLFAEKFKITENQLKQSQTNLISEMADLIKKEVHGQNHAVEQVCDILLCTKVGLRDVAKPLGKFLFVGNTSTGKSLLGKKIAKYYFGDEKAMIKLDMSEFQERGSSSALIGTTAGYIGYESGGRLSEFVKHNPSCVVLFDEIEKAHPDIINLLLQIMDDGCITDGQGYRVDFTNTIIVLTGNIGSNENKRSMGFHNSKTNDETFNTAVKKNFKPEIIARIDEVIVFNEIDEKTAKMIVWDSINRVISSLLERDILLTVEDSVIEYIHTLAKQQEAHARNVQALVRKNLETPLAKLLLKSKPKKVTAKILNNKLELE